MAKINWEELKLDFIRNRNKSLKEIAKENDLSYDYVREIAAEGNWTKEKNEYWKNVEEKAIEKAEDTTANLILRHSKVSRYIYGVGLAQLRKRIEQIENNPKAEPINDHTLLLMIKEGLKAERELYPKQLQIKGELEIEAEGVSEELTDAIYKIFKKKLIGGGDGKLPSSKKADKK